MSSTSSAPLRSPWITRFRWASWALLTVLLMAGAAWWILLSQILPRIGNWRIDLAQQATKALGVPVQIGELSGQVEGGFPVLTLKAVALLDDRGQPALSLPEVHARVSPASLWPSALWRQEVHVDRLVLVRPELVVRRDVQGRLHVAGLVLDNRASSTGSDNRALDWVLSQTLIRIEQGALVWTDELRGAPPLALRELNVALRNRPGLGARVHVFDVEATPPAEFGRRFQAHAQLSQPVWMSGPALARSTSGVGASIWQR